MLPVPATPGHTFSIPVRVYYEDTDAGGVVYYANYLRFLERCRTEWMRAVTGHDQAFLAREHNIAFAVRSVQADYLRPALLDDLLTITLEVEKLGASQAVFRQTVYREVDQTLLLTGTVKVVCVNLNPMKATPIPAFLREKLETLQ